VDSQNIKQSFDNNKHTTLGYEIHPGLWVVTRNQQIQSHQMSKIK